MILFFAEVTVLLTLKLGNAVPPFMSFYLVKEFKKVLI